VQAVVATCAPAAFAPASIVVPAHALCAIVKGFIGGRPASPLAQQSVCIRTARAVGWSKSRDRVVYLISDASELQVKRNCIDAFSTGRITAPLIA